DGIVAVDHVRTRGQLQARVVRACCNGKHVVADDHVLETGAVGCPQCVRVVDAGAVVDDQVAVHLSTQPVQELDAPGQGAVGWSGATDVGHHVVADHDVAKPRRTLRIPADPDPDLAF